ncbi:hypothetical protein B0H13DRAFT_649678 [Mycena leptocephala]|nr:hypothetical protein B0H13DRAFT_649678 [Mycena leptocephala]
MRRLSSPARTLDGASVRPIKLPEALDTCTSRWRYPYLWRRRAVHSLPPSPLFSASPITSTPSSQFLSSPSTAGAFTRPRSRRSLALCPPGHPSAPPSRQSTLTESETQNARGASRRKQDAVPWTWSEEGRRDELEGRRGGGIRVGMRGRERRERQKAGMRSYCAAPRRAGASASVTRLRYGYGAQIQ